MPLTLATTVSAVSPSAWTAPKGTSDSATARATVARKPACFAISHSPEGAASLSGVDTLPLPPYIAMVA